MRTVLATVAAGLLATSCGASPEAETAPGSDRVARFGAEPEVVIAEVRSLEDPVVQEAAVVALLEAHPGRTGALCEALDVGPLRDRCERYNSRPHLWTVAVEGASTEGVGAPRRSARLDPRPGGGPLDVRGVPPQLALPAPEADAGPCEAGRVSCLETEALDAAAAGEPERAAARCAALPTVRGQQDCLFRAAEALAAGPGTYGEATTLCLLAGSFAPECHGHVLMRRSDVLEPALDPDRDAAAAVEAEAIAAWWSSRDPAFGALAVDAFWASHLDLQRPLPLPAFSEAAATLPEAARPHLVTALGFRVSTAEDPVAHGLAWWKGAGSPVPEPSLDGVVTRRLWLRDLPGEEHIPAAALPAALDGRRPVHADLDTDLVLVLLELAARQETPDVDAIAAQAAHPEALVRWSVARLLYWLDRDHPARTALAADPDPLVARRATWTPATPEAELGRREGGVGTVQP